MAQREAAGWKSRETGKPVISLMMQTEIVIVILPHSASDGFHRELISDLEILANAQRKWLKQNYLSIEKYFKKNFTWTADVHVDLQEWRHDDNAECRMQKEERRRAG